MRFAVWNTVKVKNDTLERDGQAGVVQATDAADDLVEVKFDSDSECEWHKPADLELLQGN